MALTKGSFNQGDYFIYSIVGRVVVFFASIFEISFLKSSDKSF